MELLHINWADRTQEIIDFMDAQEGISVADDFFDTCTVVRTPPQIQMVVGHRNVDDGGENWYWCSNPGLFQNPTLFNGMLDWLFNTNGWEWARSDAVVGASGQEQAADDVKSLVGLSESNVQQVNGPVRRMLITKADFNG